VAFATRPRSAGIGVRTWGPCREPS
jgi:hypothetical protein